MGEWSQVLFSKALYGINIVLTNINKVTHSEDFKSNIKENADGKWFRLSLIVLVIVVIVHNYNELILTATIHWIVDKQVGVQTILHCHKTVLGTLESMGFWHLHDQKWQFPWT